MSKEKFRVVVGGVVTDGKEILLGKKPDTEDHPISGEWHFPEGHVDEDEEPEEAVLRELKEKTDLGAEVHQILTVYNTGTGAIRILYHCEAESNKAEAQDDLEKAKWVGVDELGETLNGTAEEDSVERDEIQNFIEKLKKMPMV